MALNEEGGPTRHIPLTRASMTDPDTGVMSTFPPPALLSVGSSNWASDAAAVAAAKAEEEVTMDDLSISNITASTSVRPRIG